MMKHGMSGTPTYKSWYNMIDRCENPKSVSFKNYGGRNISICDRWYDFRNFYADMGEKPKGLTLERKDNDKNYELENCKWATWKEQANNRRPRSCNYCIPAKKVHALRAWRTSQGLTQTEVATILGYLTPGIIHSIETHKLDPKISEVKKLCDLSEDILQPWDFLEPSGAENG